MDSKIIELKNIIEQSEKIVFFGGAGVSTESGIPDFRSSDGLYSEKWKRKYSPEEVISHTFYISHREEFWQFYREKLVFPDALPNDCHNALAELEKRGKISAVVTQNIDGLHQKAGSKNVYELHGSTLRYTCEKCGRKYTLKDIGTKENVPVCENCGGYIRPDVVLYEEGLDEETVDNAIRAIREADTLIVGGTSLIVYPAAGLLRYFSGTKLVLINMSATQADSSADLLIREPIGKVFHDVMELLKEE